MDYTIQKFMTPPLLVVKTFTSNNNERDTSQIFNNIETSFKQFTGEDLIYLIFDIRNLPDTSIEVITSCVKTLSIEQAKWQKKKKVHSWIITNTSILSTVQAIIPSDDKTLTVIDDYMLAIDAIDELFAGKDEYNSFGSNV